MRAPFLFLFLSLVPAVRAQNAEVAPSETVVVVEQIDLRDGSRLIGTVIEESEFSLTLRTVSGTEIRIDVSQILSRRLIKGRVRGGEFLPQDPNETRLFFAPTGRALKKGDGYFAAYYVFFGFAAVAVTDRLTLAGGALLIPEAIVDFAYVAPKFTFYEEGRTSAAVGVLAGFAGGNSAGIIYGVATRGHSDAAMTLGVGFGFSGGDISSAPVFVFGTERRLGRRTKFISESYLFPTEGAALVSAGLRFYGDRLAADLGLIGFVGADTVPVGPWVSFAYNFGR